jgi:hypothetical protein
MLLIICNQGNSSFDGCRMTRKLWIKWNISNYTDLKFTIFCKLQRPDRIYVSGRLKDADSKDHNHFAGSPLVFPEIDSVNIKTPIFSKFFWINFEDFLAICWQKWIELVKITLSTNFFWKIPSNSWDISDFLK